MRARHLLIPLLVLSLAAVACGDDDDTEADEGATTTAAAEADTTTTAAADATDGAATDEATMDETTTTVAPDPADAIGDELSSYEVTTADVYTPPDPLPEGEPGDLIFAEPFDTADPDVLGYRVLYLSEKVDGEATAVSGYVLTPAAAATDPQPVLTWAHGTSGSGDDCAPSLDDDLFPATDDGYGLIDQFHGFLEQGYVITATDYEGLGTPGPHPYLMGPSEGRGVLDIVTAAGQLPGVLPGGPVAIAGHSQGGHAALFAAQEAPSYAPDLDVVGVVAYAPAAEFETLLGTASTLPSFAGYFVAGMAGLASADPELDLAEVLDPEALGQIDLLETSCEAIPTFSATFSELGRPAAIADPLTIPAWQAAIDESTPGTIALEMPALVLQGTTDELGLGAIAPLLDQRMCAAGTNAELITYDGVGHGGIVSAATPEGVAFIEAVVAGEAPPDGCAN